LQYLFGLFAMKLALQTDYGLRVLMYLAGEKERCTIADICDFFGISKDHVAKVVQTLARQGFIRSIRGAGGGLELARAPEDITVGEVVQGLEGSMHLLECVAAGQQVCVIQPGCRLRKVLAEAERLQLEYLNSVRLSDVVRPGRSISSMT
jgi:Rrf2 family nitric oxide-sensitive transcriptional repressor